MALLFSVSERLPGSALTLFPSRIASNGVKSKHSSFRLHNGAEQFIFCVIIRDYRYVLNLKLTGQWKGCQRATDLTAAQVKLLW